MLELWSRVPVVFLTLGLGSLLASAGVAFSAPLRPGDTGALPEQEDFKYYDPLMFPPRPVISVFLNRGNFPTDKAYAAYVMATLKSGMRVQARENYQKVLAGMKGTYIGTGGVPPCLVMWDDDLQSSSALLPNFPKERRKHAYWVEWHHLHLLP
jgi:hypothetical protein